MTNANEKITAQLRKMLDAITSAEDVDSRARAIAVTKLEECEMWWQRAVTQGQGHAVVSGAR